MVPAKCSNQSAAKVVSASALLTLLLISIAALGVALGYEWARVDLVQNNDCSCSCTYAPCKQSCCASKFSVLVYLIPFDLGNETQAINGTVSSWVNIYQAVGFSNPTIDTSALPVVVACTLASGVLSFICLLVTSANLFLNAKSRFYRPTVTVIYSLCLFSSLFSVTAFATFLDFYIWKLRDGAGLLPSTYFRVNTAPYSLLVRLDWAFYVHAGGASCSVIAFMVACTVAPLALTPSATTPPPPQAAPPLRSAVVTALAYDKGLGKWVVREKPKESEKQLAMEAYKGSRDAAPKSDEQVVTTLH